MKISYLIASATLFASATVPAQFVQPELIFDENTVFPIINSTPSAFSDVGIDNLGNVATQSSTPRAVVARINGELVTVAAADITVVPNSNEIIADIDDHIEMRNGLAVFKVRNTVGNSGDEILMFGNGDSLTVAVWVGVDDVPGQPPGTKFTDFSDTEGFGFDGTRLAFEGDYPGGSGAYLFDNGVLSEIVSSGDLVDGLTTEFYGQLMPDARSDAIVLSISFTDDTRAIYVWENDTFTRVIGSGDPMPSGAGAIADFGLGEPDIDAGRVVLVVENDAGFESLILWDNGAIEVLADENTVFPGLPSADSFGEPGISGNTVAMPVSSEVGDNRGDSIDAAYAFQDGAVIPIVIEGQPFDGSLLENYISGNRPFVADDRVALRVSRENSFEQIYAVRIISGTQAVPTTGVLALLLLAFALMLVARRKLA